MVYVLLWSSVASFFKRYGSCSAVPKRFKNWNDKSVWSDLSKSTIVGADMQSIVIDSTIVRTHACLAGYRKDSRDQEFLGRSKGGFTTKFMFWVIL